MTSVRFNVGFLGAGRRPSTPRVNAPSARAGAPSSNTRAPVARRAEPVAQLLALAHLIEQRVVAGVWADYSAAAAHVGLRQPRVAQILRLLFLAPDIQESILAGDMQCTEHRLQAALDDMAWEAQRRTLAPMPK